MRRRTAEALPLESPELVAETTAGGGFARLSLEPSQPLVDLGHLGPAGDSAASACALALGERVLAACELLALGRQLRLSSREGLLGLLKCGQARLDVREPLLRGLGSARGSPREVCLHLQIRPLSGSKLVLPTRQLLRVRGEAYLCVRERLVVGSGHLPAGAASRPGEGVCELALPLLDGRHALGELTAKSPELLLGSDADRAQALLLGLDRDGLGVPTAE